MKTTTAVAAIASLCVAGCAIQPVTRDVTGLTSYEIARQIRCESRQALRDTVVRWFAGWHDPKLDAIAEALKTDDRAFAAFGPSTLSGTDLAGQRDIVTLFMETGIAYDFELGMSENNDLDASASFIKPLTNPVTTLGVGGTFKRTRTNTVTFTTTDTFASLVRLPSDYCKGFIAKENHVYPIAGRIGMDEAIADFVEITLFAGLTETNKVSGPPTMTRALTFRTEIGASLDPTVTFTPLDAAFQAKSLTLEAGVGRIDTHKVTVGLALPTKNAAMVESLRANIFDAGRQRLLVTSTAIGGGTSSEQMAVLAVDRFKSREVKLVTTP